jgi:hypothetical protein
MFKERERERERERKGNGETCHEYFGVWAAKLSVLKSDSDLVIS